MSASRARFLTPRCAKSTWGGGPVPGATTPQPSAGPRLRRAVMSRLAARVSVVGPVRAALPGFDVHGIPGVWLACGAWVCGPSGSRGRR